MSVRAPLSSAVMLAALAGCVSSLSLDREPPPLALGATDDLQVTLARPGGLRGQWVIGPANACHARVADWLVANRTGWQQILYTPSPFGATLKAPGLFLQVQNGVAIACDRRGCVTKAAPELGFVDNPAACGAGSLPRSGP